MTTDKPQWSLDCSNKESVLTLSGNWIAQDDQIPLFPNNKFENAAKDSSIIVDMKNVGEWDTALIAFLWNVKKSAAKAGIRFDNDSLPDSARKLFELLPEKPAEAPASNRSHFYPLAWIGDKTLKTLEEIGANTEIFWATLKGVGRIFTRKAKVRVSDILQNLNDAGPMALLIVGVVNFLIGAILAFVGTLQLKRFAAEAYVPNMIGIALVREMTPVMTAIVMAGRTGGSYAARIATMLGNEEIDALTVIGIPVSEFIVLPSIIGMLFTLPFLYLYGCLIGLIGGYAIVSLMLDGTIAGYSESVVHAVAFDQFVFGFCKSLIFAIFIAITSCRIGLKAGRSAADVGIAATRAVVVGIVGVIALDAIFAVLADVVGI